MSEERDDDGRDSGGVVRDGAAADGAEAEGEVGALPRLLRLAHHAIGGLAKPRVVAELAELLPEETAAAAAWSDNHQNRGWQPLATRLDGAAVRLDRPALRSLADAVRLSSMTVGEVRAHPAEALRVIAALDAALREADIKPTIATRLLALGEQMVIGWSALAGGDRGRFIDAGTHAHRHAYELGRAATHHVRIHEADKVSEREQHGRRAADAKAKEQTADSAAKTTVAVPADHLLVCPPLDTKANLKLRDACRGHEHAIGVPLPLAPMPDIATLRQRLIFEFPYVVAAIDTLLAPLVGRATVRFPPVCLVGAPGAGKSRLARRLSECLGVGLWRTDGARADGATFGGTDRRWYSAEPCHPFLAASRARVANPLILVDEVDKAASRSDYGRLWDSLLAFLEPETVRAYPDPCLQVDLDLSQLSLIATANSLTPLPAPLLDRLRIVEVPEPRASDLASLVTPLACDLLAEQSLDERWWQPLDADELALLAAKWRGGSVRRLRAYLAVVLRARDRGRGLN